MITTFAKTSFALVAAVSAAAFGGSPQGDYVEARTASVFAGACHYNGERVTDGRSAVMAWTIKSGDFKGQNLAGVRVLAKLTSDQNLADESSRKSEIVVDAPSDSVAAAAVAWAKSQTAGRLGEIVSVTRRPISFTKADDRITVAASGFADMTVEPMPDAACCSQPHLVWYQPLATIEHRRVGYTVAATSSAGKTGQSWQRSDENSAFYGDFGDSKTVVASR